MIKFTVYQFDTKNGVDFRIGNRRAGSLEIGSIVADTKVQAVAQLKNRLTAVVSSMLYIDTVSKVS